MLKWYQFIFEGASCKINECNLFFTICEGFVCMCIVVSFHCLTSTLSFRGRNKSNIWFLIPYGILTDIHNIEYTQRFYKMFLSKSLLLPIVIRPLSHNFNNTLVRNVNVKCFNQVDSIQKVPSILFALYKLLVKIQDTKR